MDALILVVDDEGAIADLVATVLEDEGYRVAVAYDGLTALEMATRILPDLIVSDVHMPRLDGVALLRRLRAIGHPAPVVLMSAVNSYREMERGHFVPKPFDLDQLLTVVGEALGESASPT